MLHNSAAFGHLRLDDDDASERNGDASRRSSGSLRRSKAGTDDDEWEDER